MIYILTAMYAEAHPFITRFQLKKDISHTRFQVFLNAEAQIHGTNMGQTGVCQADIHPAGICLIVSGTGSVPAAVALSSICTEYGPGQGDFLVNVGVCAQIWGQTPHLTPQLMAQKESRTKSLCQRGNIFLCNKIEEQSTGKTFYPDILYRHSFSEAQIITGAKPYTKMDYITSPASQDSLLAKAEAENFYLYDMEAAAIYQAGSYYFGPHQMSFLKVVSDNGNTEAVTPAEIERLITSNMENIADYITSLQDITHKELSEEAFQNEAVQRQVEQLCLAMHCSKVMSESLRQHIRYCILAGVDYVSVLDSMYREGKLPCKDKREGKLCFEELKERLL